MPVNKGFRRSNWDISAEDKSGPASVQSGILLNISTLQDAPDVTKKLENNDLKGTKYSILFCSIVVFST